MFIFISPQLETNGWVRRKTQERYFCRTADEKILELVLGGFYARMKLVSDTVEKTEKTLGYLGTRRRKKIRKKFHVRF